MGEIIVKIIPVNGEQSTEKLASLTSIIIMAGWLPIHFPPSIAATYLRYDLVVWSNKQHTVVLAKLTIVSKSSSHSIMVSTTGHSTYPFCNGSYLKLRKHLPHCKERDGRDYTHLLSAKTLGNRSQSKKTECPKCHNFFKRLDTHFRVSATCK